MLLSETNEMQVDMLIHAGNRLRLYYPKNGIDICTHDLHEAMP
jgi:hypothetical protein